MIFELGLIVGSEAVAEMADRWKAMCQKLVESPSADPSGSIDLVNFLDRKFRGSGINSKGFPLFTIHEVTLACMYSIDMFVHSEIQKLRIQCKVQL